MFFNKSSIVEKLSKVPQTLADISVDIFGGVTTNNDFLHKVSLPAKNAPNTYLCEGLCKGVNLEKELMYPYVYGAVSGGFALQPASYVFMLPYEVSGEGLKKEPRLIPAAELKARFPMAYSRIQEFKQEFHHDGSELEAEYYGVQGKKLLEYLNTPKIIVTEPSRLEAAYDASGNHVFEGDSCGIVLRDESKYPYVLAVLNSPLARLLPELCNSEKLYYSTLNPEALKRFPIVFPENKLTEDLISTLSLYLIYLHGQKAVSDSECGELIGFYEQVLNLLVLDTYLTNNLDPEFLDLLNANIKRFAGNFESAGDKNLLLEMQAVKQNLMDASSPGKYRFDLGLTGILAVPQNSGMF